jgi:hypothetical protein
MTTEPEHDSVARLLESSRPVPRAAFRGALRRRIVNESRHRSSTRVQRHIAAYAGSGALMLAIAIAGLAGTGPLAP